MEVHSQISSCNIPPSNFRAHDHVGEFRDSGPVKRWATKEDWTSQQPTIQRLYLHEGRPLSEVMHIMETDHGFRATPKMYKQRIGRWGWQKRNKDNSKTTTAGKVVSQMPLAKTDSRSNVCTTNAESTHREQKRKRLGSAPAVDEESDCSSCQDVATVDIPSSPKDPENLRMIAFTLKNTSDYIFGAFDSGTFVLPKDNKSRLISSKPGGDQVVPLRDLFTQHYTACSLLDGGLNSEAVKILDNASAGLKRIVVAEHPRTLPTILALVLYLRARNRYEIADMLLRQFVGFVRVCLGPNHPFEQNCRTFMPLDAPSHDHLLAQGCRYGNHIYKTILGPNYDMGENSLQRAIVMLQDLACGRQILTESPGPVHPDHWPDMLGEAFCYQGRFNMAGRVALLIERSPRVGYPSPSMINQKLAT